MRKSLIILTLLCPMAGTSFAQEPAGGKAAASLSAVAKTLRGYSQLAVPCEDGFAAEFPCSGVDLLAFMPLTEVGPVTTGLRTSDIWGWTDPETGSEYALLGLNAGTSFIDVTNPVNPVLVGFLPRVNGTRASVWRDVKVYNDYAFIVADGASGHGMQVFDLTRLRSVVNKPAEFVSDTRYTEFGSAHNIAINTESGYTYIVGSSGGDNTCGGGLQMVDVRDTATGPRKVNSHPSPNSRSI